MKKGILFAIGAYLIWGFMPVYLKSIQGVPALQILGHRITWSFILLAIIILILHQGKVLLRSAASLRILGVYSLAAILLAANWLTYIWAVNSGQVIESSLGYFINPLVSVLFGLIFFKERLRPWQWLPLGVATAGVIYLTVDFGRLPWIALLLAATFGLYGLVKKMSPLSALPGLTLETAILFLPALAYLVFVEIQGTGAFGQGDARLSLLLAFAGVITAVPLLLFGTAARQIPLSLLGILQYITPTCQFLLGVFVFHEPFSNDRLIGFSIIWLALLLFWLESWLHIRSTLTR